MTPRVVTLFGGSGFIGRHLVRRLAAEAAIVRVAVRRPERANFLKTAGDVGQIVLTQANVRDDASVTAAMEGAEAVVNLVGILAEAGRQKFDAIHAAAAGRIARAARAAGVKCLVQVSALGADPKSPSRYARTKAAGEAAAREAFPEATILRPCVVFGPEDGFLNRFASLARAAPLFPVFYEGFLPGLRFDGLFPYPVFDWGTNKMQPVFVDDVAQAIVKAIGDPGCAGKTYELGGPTVYAFKEILELILAEIRCRRLLLPVPFFAAEIIATFLELMPEPPLTRDQLKLFRRDNIVTSGALTLKDLAITPTSMEVIAPTYLARYRGPKARSAPQPES